MYVFISDLPSVGGIGYIGFGVQVVKCVYVCV